MSFGTLNQKPLQGKEFIPSLFIIFPGFMDGSQPYADYGETDRYPR